MNLRVYFLISCGWHRIYIWQVHTALNNKLLCQAVQGLGSYYHGVAFVVHELRLFKVSVLGDVEQLFSCSRVLVDRCVQILGLVRLFVRFNHDYK